MEYLNSPRLKAWLEKSGWGAAAVQDSFIIDPEQHVKQSQELADNSQIARDEIPDRAAFRCLTLISAKGTPVTSNESAIALQVSQVAERARQQREHEVILLGELASFKKAQAESLERVKALDLRLGATEESISAGAASLKVAVAESAASIAMAVTNEQARQDGAAGRITEQLCEMQRDSFAIKAELRCIQGTQSDTSARLHKERVAAWIRFGITAGLLLILMLLFAVKGHAQQANVNPAIVVATCNAATLVAGQRAYLTTGTDGGLCLAPISVSASVATAGLSSSANQTNGTQKTQVCDAGGDCVTVTGSALDVNAVVNVPGSLVVSTSLGSSGTVTVVGAASDGTTATFSPVQIGGKDDAGAIQTIRTTVAGNTVVSLETTAGIIGAVTVGSTVNVNFLTASPNVTVSTALPAGTNNIGDIDVLTLPNVTLNSGQTVNVNFLTAAPSVTVTDGAGALNVIIDSGTTTVTQGTGTNLHTVVDSGAVTVSGGTVNVQGVTGGVAVTVAGVSGGVVTAEITDTTGRQIIVGAAPNFSGIQGAPVRIGGATGSTTYDITTDTSGRQVMVGAAASGQIAQGAPVLTGGGTGTGVYTIAVDTSGREIVTGATPSGGVTQGNPVAIAAATGSNTYAVTGDTSGRLAVVGAAPSGGLTQGAPVLAGGASGGLTVSIAIDTSGRQIVTGASVDGFYVSVSIATDTTIIAGTANTYTYLTLVDIWPLASATNIALVEGTGTNCATNISGMAGGTTAANGGNFAANGGIVIGVGIAPIFRTKTPGNNICLKLSAANQIAGHMVGYKQ